MGGMAGRVSARRHTKDAAACFSLRRTTDRRLTPSFPLPHPTAKGGDPELVRASERRRFADPDRVDRVLALDAEYMAGAFWFFFPLFFTS